MARKKQERQIKTQVIGLNTSANKEIKEQIKIYTKVLENIFDEHTTMCNSLYSNPASLDKNTQSAELLFQKSLELLNALNDYATKYINNTFMNAFYLLKIKTCVLVGKTRLASLLSVEHHQHAMACFIQAYTLLYQHLEQLDYLKDGLFQELMNYCLNEICSKKIQIILPNNGNNSKLIYDFAEKCSDNTLKIHWQYPVIEHFILERELTLKQKAERYRDFIGLYNDALSQLEALKKNNQFTMRERIKYLIGTSIVLNFVEKCHPSLRTIGLEPQFNRDNKENLKNFMKLYNEFKDTYLKRMLDLISGIDLDAIGSMEHYEIRSKGEELLQHFKKYIKHFLSWHKLLNENDGKTVIESSRKSIIALYHDFKQLVIFYNTYFEKYPESNYRSLTPVISFFTPQNDYQKKINTLDAINQTMLDFEKEEVIRDALFLEAKQAKLAICEEAAQFLIDLQKKENQFVHERRLAKISRQSQVKAIQHKPEKVRDTSQNYDIIIKEPMPVYELPYFERAAKSIETHAYYNALTLYELAYNESVECKDLYTQLRAVDGLAFTYGNIVLGDMAKLLSLLKTRLKSTTPLTRLLRIDLETSIYDIVCKLNQIQNAYLELMDLSQNDALILDEACHAGINHAQHQITDLIGYLSKQAKAIQIEYTKVIQKAIADKDAFIYKLGREAASHLNMKQHKSEIKTLGLLKFAEIGKKASDAGAGPSDYTYERELFNALNKYVKNVCITTHTIKTNPKDSLILQDILPEKSKLLKSSMVIHIPASIQEVFSFLDTLSDEHYLFGSAVLECILKMHKQESIFPQDLDMITRCDENKITAAGFNPCLYISNLYYYQYKKWRIELSQIKEDAFVFMVNRVFTISTLFCQKRDNEYVVHDLTGRGLNDLEHMRLVTLEDPKVVFSKDPTTILLCFKYCLKGFHPDLKIINALKNLQILEPFDRGHLNAIAKKQLLSLDLEGRKRYVNLLVHYGVIKKLFEIHYACDLLKTVGELESNLGVASVSMTANPHGLFATNNAMEHGIIIKAEAFDRVL